ncbi:hypothetical protein MMC28_005276 [Mycoblastus sanguinarius]|nr:hypothetical protein [Mycoblastus sanguinarius]
MAPPMKTFLFALLLSLTTVSAQTIEVFYDANCKDLINTYKGCDTSKTIDPGKDIYSWKITTASDGCSVTAQGVYDTWMLCTDASSCGESSEVLGGSGGVGGCDPSYGCLQPETVTGGETKNISAVLLRCVENYNSDSNGG